jgi:SAM-dependent methyltransferase
VSLTALRPARWHGVAGRARPALDLSVIIPALDEGPNLAVMLPQLRQVLQELGAANEILIVVQRSDPQTRAAAARAGARVIEQDEGGYGGALRTGFAAARGRYLLTMDADCSHRPIVLRDLWRRRHAAEISIASRYVPGGQARMPPGRYLLSRILNTFFSRGLSLTVRDMSSGFRLYRADTIRDLTSRRRGFDILQEILVHAYARGWQVQEVPFEYVARNQGSSHARLLSLGLAYLRSVWPLWKLRNSIASADYDNRAYDSPIFLQRFWQRRRFRHVNGLASGQGPVLDVGCGSSRILSALPPGSVGVDIALSKLRYARRFSRPLVQASGFTLPFPDGAFPCVVCSQVIEHVALAPPMLDELCRVLAPGGRLVLGTPDYAHWQWTTLERLYRLVAPGGYGDEHISHYTREGLVDALRTRGLAIEATHYILQGELIMAARAPNPSG